MMIMMMGFANYIFNEVCSFGPAIGTLLILTLIAGIIVCPAITSRLADITMMLQEVIALVFFVAIVDVFDDM
jgi:hypothetical protein